MSEQSIPCGGCGATENSKRCIGCMHDFGTKESAWVRAYIFRNGEVLNYERGEGDMVQVVYHGAFPNGVLVSRHDNEDAFFVGFWDLKKTQVTGRVRV